MDISWSMMMIIMEIRYPWLFPLSKKGMNSLSFRLFEGIQLEALLSKFKIDADDYLSQIILVGEDLVGAITVEEA